MGIRQVKRGELVLLATLTGIFLVSLVWYPPDDGGFVVCLFNRMTGLPCPGCGFTRSFCAIGKGELGRAVAFHPLGPAVFLAAFLYWGRGLALVGGMRSLVGRFDGLVRRYRLALVGLGFVLVVWIVRLSMIAIDGRLTEMARHGLLFRALGIV